MPWSWIGIAGTGLLASPVDSNGLGAAILVTGLAMAFSSRMDHRWSRRPAGDGRGTAVRAWWRWTGRRAAMLRRAWVWRTWRASWRTSGHAGRRSHHRRRWWRLGGTHRHLVGHVV